MSCGTFCRPLRGLWFHGDLSPGFAKLTRGYRLSPAMRAHIVATRVLLPPVASHPIEPKTGSLRPRFGSTL